jgi:hypothetical protein
VASVSRCGRLLAVAQTSVETQTVVPDRRGSLFGVAVGDEPDDLLVLERAPLELGTPVREPGPGTA